MVRTELVQNVVQHTDDGARIYVEAAPDNGKPPLVFSNSLGTNLKMWDGQVAEATERRGPHAIPNYAIRLADDFHRFYHDHKVLGSEAEAFRLGLVTATRSVIARCLDLIGVEAPDRM